MSLQDEIKRLSIKGCYKSTKKWWLQLEPREKSIVIAIIGIAISSPFILAWAKKLTITKVSVIAANEAGTHTLIEMVQVAAPLWNKVLATTLVTVVVGIGSAFLAGLTPVYNTSNKA